jgi:hypothetical protein
LHDELKYITTCAASEAMVDTFVGHNIEGRCFFLVEWTKANITATLSG